jgi:hypothetical protein
VGKNFAVLDIFLWDIYKDPPPQFFGGIMHLKPTAGCQISILIFEEKKL